MLKGDASEEGSARDLDSDKYTLDDLDLLNLRVSFSSEGRRKSDSRSAKGTKEDLCSGDHHFARPVDRERRRQNWSEDTLKDHRSSSSASHQSGNVNVALPVTDAPKPRVKPTKSVILLYSNRKYSGESLHRGVSDEFLVPRRKKELRGRRILANGLHINENSRNISNSVGDREGSSGRFPFSVTSSGNYKINSNQVVFESKKLSVVVADPCRTKVNIKGKPLEKAAIMQREGEGMRNMFEHIVPSSSMDHNFVKKLTEQPPQRRDKEASEYEGKAINEILDPELNLNRLGYTASDLIDWNEVVLPEKKNLYLELYSRITNFTNADCKVYIDNEEFNCHLLVLQCYSEVFHTYVAVKKVELPADKCSPSSFGFIYEWMITGDPSYRNLNRENVLEIFNAAKYLKIRDLVEQCWAFIDNPDVFNEDTAFLLYIDARDKNLPEVRELMLPRIQKFFLMLVSSQDWLELELDDVQNLLQSNYICINCEMEVFMSAMRWLKHDYENRSKFKVPLLKCVRFGNIAPWQLVDIKRNLDNQDFKEAAMDPEICKMIDDGLAFVIIKYWYGQENEDYQHWNSILSLKEPPTRNWSGMDKTYFTYREFLIYLDQYRRVQMIEKSKPKEKRKKLLEHNLHSETMDTFDRRSVTKMGINDGPLKKTNKSPRKAKLPPVLFSKPRRFVPPSSCYARKPPSPSPRSAKTGMTRNHAATVIQRAFRKHINRKIEKNFKQTPKDNYRWTNSSPQVYTMSQYRNKDVDVKSKKIRDLTMDSSLFIYDRESVLVFGGIDPHSNYGVGRNTGKDVYRYVPDRNEWQFVSEMPEPRHHHQVAFHRGRAYLVGGADPRTEDKRGKSTVVGTVWSFCPAKRYWYNEEALNDKRKNFGLVATDHYLFAIGGQDTNGRTLPSVERYSTVTGKWTQCAPLTFPKMGIACAKFQDKIWTAGGMSGSKRTPLSNNVECYDIDLDQWTQITKLRYPRCFSCMLDMSNKLYLIGGAGKLSTKDKTTTSLSTIDVWNDKMEEWEKISDMTIPRHGHAVAYLGTQILIIGGVTTVYMRALSNIECFCGNRGSWVRGIQPLPTALSGHAAITLPPAKLM